MSYIIRMEQLRSALPDLFTFIEEVYINRLTNGVIDFPEFDHVRQDLPEDFSSLVDMLTWAASQ